MSGAWGDWLDTEKLRWLLLAPIGLVAAGLYLVVRFVGKLLTRVALVVVLVGLGVSLWLQRADLVDCAQDLLMHAVRPSGSGPRRHEPELLSRLSEFERELLQNQATVEPIGVRQDHIHNHVLVQKQAFLSVGYNLVPVSARYRLG